MSTHLSTTSYAILGLLTVRSWTAYELTQQMQRSLQRFWPRAESKLYEEPKKLTALGLASGVSDLAGRRRRTRYAATARGRRALARWLAQPGEPPVLEAEHLVKVFLAEYGTKRDLLATLRNVHDWADEQMAKDGEIAQSYLTGPGQFPSRRAQLVLVGKFISDFAYMSHQWAEWATEVVSEWPDDVSQADPALDAFAEIAERSRAVLDAAKRRA